MTEDVDAAILSLIADNSTQWNWYKLDRALSAKGLGGQFNVAAVATDLAQSGLIEEVSADNPAMPIYKITAKGRQFLRRE